MKLIKFSILLVFLSLFTIKNVHCHDSDTAASLSPGKSRALLSRMTQPPIGADNKSPKYETPSDQPFPQPPQKKGWGSWLIDQGKSWGGWAIDRIKDSGLYGKATINWFKNNPNMVIHGLTDGLTIVAINMGSFGNIPGMMVEMAIFVPRWYYGYTFMKECDEQISKASSSTAPHARENQILVVAKKGSGIIHLASDAADIAIRALRDGVGLIVAPSVKTAVTTVTFVTQLFDFGVAYKAEVNNLQDEGKKSQ